MSRRRAREVNDEAPIDARVLRIARPAGRCAGAGCDRAGDSGAIGFEVNGRLGDQGGGGSSRSVPGNRPTGQKRLRPIRADAADRAQVAPLAPLGHRLRRGYCWGHRNNRLQAQRRHHGKHGRAVGRPPIARHVGCRTGRVLNRAGGGKSTDRNGARRPRSSRAGSEPRSLTRSHSARDVRPGPHRAGDSRRCANRAPGSAGPSAGPRPFSA